MAAVAHDFACALPAALEAGDAADPPGREPATEAGEADAGEEEDDEERDDEREDGTRALSD